MTNSRSCILFLYVLVAVIVIGEVQSTRIAPWLNVWDGWPNVEALSPPNMIKASAGADKAMQNASKLNAPVNGASREYLNLQGFTWSNTSARANTAEYLGTRRVLICFWFTSTDHYGDQSFKDTIAGLRDNDFKTAIESLPIGRNRPLTGELYQFYFAYEHEPDTYMTPTQNRTLYVQAVQYAMNYSIHVALSMGAVPYEFGTGGLVTGVALGMPNQGGWNWQANLPKSLLDTGMVVWFEDTYFYITAQSTGLVGLDGNKYACKSFLTKVNAHMLIPTAAGITRLVIGETACALSVNSFDGPIVGTDDMQVAWLDEVKTWLQTVGEGVSLFSNTDGPASHNGELRGSSMVQAGYMCKDFNRTPRRPNITLSTPPTIAPPTKLPTKAPTAKPATKAPTAAPTTKAPTKAPTNEPATKAPTASPTTKAPTKSPTKAPTKAPTKRPTMAPTVAPPVCVPASNSWVISPLHTVQNSSFTFTFTATPNVAPDHGFFGISNGIQTDGTKYSVVVRFDPSSGNIQAYQGTTGYKSDASVAYVKDTTYQFTITVNVNAKTYTVVVQPTGASPVTIAANYAFRYAASSLSHYGVLDIAAGSKTVFCDFKLNGLVLTSAGDASHIRIGLTIDFTFNVSDSNAAFPVLDFCAAVVAAAHIDTTVTEVDCSITTTDTVNSKIIVRASMQLTAADNWQNILQLIQTASNSTSSTDSNGGASDSSNDVVSDGNPTSPSIIGHSFSFISLASASDTSQDSSSSSSVIESSSSMSVESTSVDVSGSNSNEETTSSSETTPVDTTTTTSESTMSESEQATTTGDDSSSTTGAGSTTAASTATSSVTGSTSTSASTSATVGSITTTSNLADQVASASKITAHVVLFFVVIIAALQVL